MLRLIVISGLVGAFLMWPVHATPTLEVHIQSGGESVAVTGIEGHPGVIEVLPRAVATRWSGVKVSGAEILLTSDSEFHVTAVQKRGWLSIARVSGRGLEFRVRHGERFLRMETEDEVARGTAESPWPAWAGGAPRVRELMAGPESEATGWMPGQGLLRR